MKGIDFSEIANYLCIPRIFLEPYCYDKNFQITKKEEDIETVVLMS